MQPSSPDNQTHLISIFTWGAIEMGQLLILVGGILFIGALTGSIAAYINDRERRNGKGRSIILYSTGTLLAGVLACVLIVPVLFIACSSEACAWVITIIALPGVFALGVSTFVYFWVRHGSKPLAYPNVAVQKPVAKTAI